MKRLWLVFLGVWIFSAAGQSSAAGVSKKKKEKRDKENVSVSSTAPSSVHEEPRPIPTEENIQQELDQCVNNFKESGLSQIKIQPERFYYWRLCEALQMMDPAPCEKLKPLSAELKKMGLTVLSCAEDAMFDRLIVSAAQNSYENCVKGLSKFPNSLDKSVETVCREVMEAQQRRDPGSLYPFLYWAAGSQHCSKLSGGEYTEKSCIEDVKKLNAAEAKDMKICKRNDMDCYINVGIVREDKQICQKVGSYVKRSYCLDDMQSRLEKDKTVSGEHRNRLRDVREKNIEESLK